MIPQMLYDKLWLWDSHVVHVEAAVRKVLAQGLRTGDIHQAGTKKVGTSEMGDAVVAAL